ncbi:MAG: hypothetical protein IJV93_12055 [Lentisphaeria bacterium]|nr:hypothetical protein [Lentisphaeria bacterium]
MSMEPKSVINQEFDRSGRYEGGLKALVKSLQYAFVILLVAIVGMIVYFFTWGGYFSVEPQQAVIVLRFGKFHGAYQDGARWFMPYPVHRFIRVQTNQQQLDVNFLPVEIPGEEVKASLTPGDDRYLLTGDANIIHASWQVAYKVIDPKKYYEKLCTPANPVVAGRILEDDMVTDFNGFTSGRGPRTFLTKLFESAVIRITAMEKVDNILFAKKLEYKTRVEELFSRMVADFDCGIQIENVTLLRAFPPSRTKAAFDEATAAGNASSELRSKALTYKVETENEARAKAAEIVAAARAYKSRVVADMKAETEYFKAINAKYKESPRTVLIALYTAALSEAMQASTEDRFIMGSSNKKRQIRVQLNPQPKNRPAPQKDAAKEGK